ncbi:hypothetical protein ACWF5S_03960 [Peribacillus butanolivorans]
MPIRIKSKNQDSRVKITYVEIIGNTIINPLTAEVIAIAIPSLLLI